MKVSLRGMAWMLVNLLVLVTLLSCLAGYALLREHYQTEESRYEAEARSRLAEAATAIANQLEFYQGFLRVLANRPVTRDIIQFSDEIQILEWTLQQRQLIPGAFGVALTRPDHSIIGDPLSQRIGDECVSDLLHFAERRNISSGNTNLYPLVHANVPGLEHFDLLQTLPGDFGEYAGTLLISFRLDTLQSTLDQVRLRNDQLRILSSNGKLLLHSGVAPQDNSHYTQSISGTTWQMELTTGATPATHFFRNLVLLNLGIVLGFALTIAYFVRHFTALIDHDMLSLRKRIASVLSGHFNREKHQPRIHEIAELVPQIDLIAQTIAAQQDALREQALIDPMTGLHNRRHFDFLVQHVFEHSRRQLPALLLIVDVNKFKTVNDALGHKAGDKALVNVADFLRDHIRASDEVARIGGDEFALILQDMPYDAWVERLLRSYDATLTGDQYARLPGGACTLSIGAAVLDSRVYANSEDAVHHADLAMYRAKSIDGRASRYHKASYQAPIDIAFDKERNAAES